MAKQKKRTRRRFSDEFKAETVSTRSTNPCFLRPSTGDPALF